MQPNPIVYPNSTNPVPNNNYVESNANGTQISPIHDKFQYSNMNVTMSWIVNATAPQNKSIITKIREKIQGSTEDEDLKPILKNG